MNTSIAIRYHEYGTPGEVLQLEELPLATPQANEVLIKLKAAVVNPSDFGMILGKYGKLKELPAIAGREGIGEIVEVGSDVQGYEVGDWVRFPEDQGVWQTACVTKAKDLFKVPNDIPEEMAAMAFVNPPTAWRILRDAHLSEGDWIIQNAANSAVGICAIQMAKCLGLKTINVVRRSELVDELKAFGADIVLLDTDDYPKQIKEITKGAKVKLALNSVGGESAIRLIKSLSDGGRMVTFGGMVFEAVRFPTRYFIFNDIKLDGFWMDRWYREQSSERVKIMFSRLFSLMRDGTIKAPVEKVYNLSEFKEAVAHAAQPRLGKILFKAD